MSWEFNKKRKSEYQLYRKEIKHKYRSHFLCLLVSQVKSDKCVCVCVFPGNRSFGKILGKCFSNELFFIYDHKQ